MHMAEALVVISGEERRVLEHGKEVNNVVPRKHRWRVEC